MYDIIFIGIASKETVQDITINRGNCAGYDQYIRVPFEIEHGQYIKYATTSSKCVPIEIGIKTAYSNKSISIDYKSGTTDDHLLVQTASYQFDIPGYGQRITSTYHFFMLTSREDNLVVKSVLVNDGSCGKIQDYEGALPMHLNFGQTYTALLVNTIIDCTPSLLKIVTNQGTSVFETAR